MMELKDDTLQSKFESSSESHGVLPRSIRWKLDLKLLKTYPSTHATVENTSGNGANQKDDGGFSSFSNDAVEPLSATTSNNSTNMTVTGGTRSGVRVNPSTGTRKDRTNNKNNNQIKDIELKNKKLLSENRQRYDNLFEKHYKKSSAIEIIHQSEPKKVSGSKGSGEDRNGAFALTPKRGGVNGIGGTSGTSGAASIEDPLSVFAQIEEQKVKSEKEKEMELKKERALASRTQHSVAHNHQQHQQHQELRKKMTMIEQQQEDDQVGMKWSQFYSSRDIMDIIEKDVDRLPIDHQIIPFYTKMKNSECSTTDSSRVATFDLVNEIKRMNQNLESSNETCDQIMKECRRERSIFISQILFVYAKEYPIIGYRQGKFWQLDSEWFQLCDHVLF